MTKTKIFLSPSLQTWNKGVGDYGTEEENMRAIADLVFAQLQRNPRYVVFISDRQDDLSAAINFSNSVQADLHIALHSNAGGGRGTEAYYAQGDVAGQRLAQCLYEQVTPIFPLSNRITPVKSSSVLLELNRAKATAVIIEVGYHDHVEEAKTIKQNYRQIADAICRGVSNYLHEGVTIRYNGELFQPENEIKLIDGKVYLTFSDLARLLFGEYGAPLREIAEHFHKKIMWEQDTQTVYISDKEEG